VRHAQKWVALTAREILLIAGHKPSAMSFNKFYGSITETRSTDSEEFLVAETRYTKPEMCFNKETSQTKP